MRAPGDHETNDPSASHLARAAALGPLRSVISQGVVSRPGTSPQPGPPTAASPPQPNPVPSPRQPKLLDRLREVLRSRHYSRRTEQTYRQRVKRFIFTSGTWPMAGGGCRSPRPWIVSIPTPQRIGEAMGLPNDHDLHPSGKEVTGFSPKVQRGFIQIRGVCLCGYTDCIILGVKAKQIQRLMPHMPCREVRTNEQRTTSIPQLGRCRTPVNVPAGRQRPNEGCRRFLWKIQVRSGSVQRKLFCGTGSGTCPLTEMQTNRCGGLSDHTQRHTVLLGRHCGISSPRLSNGSVFFRRSAEPVNNFETLTVNI